MYSADALGIFRVKRKTGLNWFSAVRTSSPSCNSSIRFSNPPVKKSKVVQSGKGKGKGKRIGNGNENENGKGNEHGKGNGSVWLEGNTQGKKLLTSDLHRCA